MSANQNVFIKYPQSVWLVPDPLGLYLRVAKNDHRHLLDFIASGDANCNGAVFDPTFLGRHRELREQLLGQRFEAMLDPMTQQSALPGGFTQQLGELPWGVGRPHTVSDFQSTPSRRLISELASFAIDHGFSQILAPTHVLRTVDDPWLTLDLSSVNRLRDELDKRNSSTTDIIYSLAIPYSAFRDSKQRRELIRGLRGLPVSAIWLKIDGFGATGTATAARNYLKGASDFHELGVPIVADQVGGLIGLGLLAFGAVGGIAHGVTFGERFDANPWRKPQGSGFRQPHRVYFPTLDLMLRPDQARILLDSSARARSLFGCRDTRCCPRGVTDMLENRGRHFLYQRVTEIQGLTQVPDQLRPQKFLEDHLRPTTDRALALANSRWGDEKMAKKIREHRKRLDMLRVALGDEASQRPTQSFSRVPKRRSARVT